MANAQCNPQILLDLSTPFDQQKVDVLDTVIKAMFNSSDEQTIKYANNILENFKNLPDAWKFVSIILSNSQNSNTKYFALQILENCIQTRWKILPNDEKEGIKQYVSHMTLELSTNEQIYNNQRHFVNKINDNFIQIVKQEWPHNWPNFITEICQSARSNQAICENNLKLLSLLSEEVFDFGGDNMASKKVNYLMEQFAAQFQEVFDLCIFILYNNIKNPLETKTSLVQQTLRCLINFLKWIPYGYIFEIFRLEDHQITLLDLLLGHFWEPLVFRLDCIKCLTEISSLSLDKSEIDQYSSHLDRFFKAFVHKLSTIPESTLHYDDPNKLLEQMRQTWELFYRHLALFLTAFLKNHRETICETPENKEALIMLLNMLVKITEINDDETFKICLDYWLSFLHELMNDVHTSFEKLSLENKIKHISQETAIMHTEALLENFAFNEPLKNPEMLSPKLNLYFFIFQNLLITLLHKMAKPQEVYIQFDQETEEVTREYEIDTDEIALYNQMRSILILITNLMQNSTNDIILKNLYQECQNSPKEGEIWNPTTLNKICFAVGGISGAMSEYNERSFIINVIKTLLKLCEMKRNKPDKAIVASCIMHVVGQYPRFLKANKNFLFVVIKKLVEFMHEEFPGVQDMACEAFLKIATKCKNVLASPTNVEEYSSFLQKILNEYLEYCKDLDEKQILLFYEAIGYIISSSNDKAANINKLLTVSNQEWLNLMESSKHNSNVIYNKEIARQLLRIIRINTRIARTCGSAFTNQLTNIFQQLLFLYHSYTSYISNQIQIKGANITKYIEIKVLTLIKREILHLVEAYVKQTSTEKTNFDETLINQIIGPILMVFLEDYKNNVPATRDHQVLSLISVFMKHLGKQLTSAIPIIFNCVFDTTLEMIKLDFRSYPDHREKFYEMLKNCNKFCFDGLFALPSEQLQTYVESLVWAFKHELPQIAEQGLELTYEFLHKLVTQNITILQDFCDRFYYNLMKEILTVLTDRLHRSGFKFQTMIFRLLLQFIELKLIDREATGLQKPLVIKNLVDLLLCSFETVNKQQVEAFVLDLFNYSTENDTLKFQSHIRDFLISLKEFSGNNSELYEADRLDALKRAQENEQKRTAMIPGMLAQFENLSSIRDNEDENY